MSRRDEMVERLDGALNTFRRDLSAALDPPTPQSGAPAATQQPASLGRRLSAAISGALDLPPPASAGQAGQLQANGGRDGVIPGDQRSGPGPAPPRSPLAQVPFGADEHHVFPLPAAAPPSAPPTTDPSAPDALPEYSRRPPPAAAQPSAPNVHLPPTRLHVHTSKTRKLELHLQARGEQHVVLVQQAPGAPVPIEGKLVMHLQQPEAISFLRIRVKGVVRTLVNKANAYGGGTAGNNTFPDEAVIFEDGYDLWDPSLPLPSPSTSPSTDQLQGTFAFPFSLQIPGEVLGPPLTGQGEESRRMRPTPPSFVLAPGGGGRQHGAEWATCRYYVKVTLGRKGMLKVNERFIVPCIFVPRAPEPEMSARRAQALLEGRPIPSPLEDPRGWGGTQIRKQVKKGVFQNKRAWYEVTLLLPKPTEFARLSAVPFAVKITSSDPSLTTSFPISAVQAQFVQRTYVSSQGVSQIHDMKVAVPVLDDDGPREGTRIAPKREQEGGGDDGEAIWEKRINGSVELTKNVGSSFITSNLRVEFYLAVRVSCPGVGNDAELACTVEVRSCSPPANGIVRLSATQDDTMGLPPSYFEAVEDGGERGGKN